MSKIAINENGVRAFSLNKDVKLVGDRLITVPKKKGKGFFLVEIDFHEGEIDELLSDEL